MSELLKSASPRAVAAELRRAGPFRLALGTVGAATVGYAIVSILRDTDHTKPIEVAKWLIGTVIIHDGVIAGVTVGVAWLIARVVPRRARAFVQSGLAVAAVTTLFALPLIYRRGKSSPGSTLVRQNYVGNLTIILAAIAAVTVACYLARLIRDRRRVLEREPEAP